MILKNPLVIFQKFFANKKIGEQLHFTTVLYFMISFMVRKVFTKCAFNIFQNHILKFHEIYAVLSSNAI